MPYATRPAPRFGVCRCIRIKCWRRSSSSEREERIEGFCLRECHERARGGRGAEDRRHRAAAGRRPGSARADEGYIDSPDRIVNVKNALDTTVTSTPEGGLKIGAAVKIIDLYENQQVARMYPALNAAAIEIGTPQIRHQATVGGNINQRPRCWYYRNEEFVCYKKGGSRCFAVDGENQYRAIFGNDGPSHIVHPSSLAVPFAAYGARFRVLGPKGDREIAASDFFTMPTLASVLKENVLEDEEILTHVIL